MEVAELEHQAMRLDLAEEICEKEAHAADLHMRAHQARAENAELFARLEAERGAMVALQQEVEGLRVAMENKEQHEDLELAGLEAQLVDAIEVQATLRFAVLQSQAEAEEALRVRHSFQARSAELRDRLEEARSSYVYAIDALDWRVASLERESREAEQTAERLERALESTAFRMRVADVELQRWS